MNVLSEAAGRVFSCWVTNLYRVTNLYNKTDIMYMYSSYTKIYDSKLVPIMDYWSSVWGLNVTPNQILFIIELYVTFLVFINVLKMQ